MGRGCERSTLLSRDVAAAIRHYCFNNLSQFYGRYAYELGVSRSSFFRIMQGEYATSGNVTAVEELARRLGLAEAGGGSQYLVRSRVTSRLVRLVDRVLSEPTVANLDELRKFITTNRGVLT